MDEPKEQSKGTYETVEVEYLVAMIHDHAILLCEPPGPLTDPRSEIWEIARNQKEELCDVKAEQFRHKR